MDEYMEVYAAFKNLFDAYFGENAAGYWEIFKNTNMKKICHTKNWQYYTIIPQLK